MDRGDDKVTRTPPAADAARWRLREAVLDLAFPRIMAICNVTPDSFSDGGAHDSVDRALHYAESALRDGATLLDIGGESTRPGATPVTLDEELARVMPVLEAVRDRLPELLLTIDTVKAGVARAALDAGAHAINDVSAGRLDPQMFGVVAAAQAGIVLMHSRGTVAEMATYALADYAGDVTQVVTDELRARRTLALAAGMTAEAIVLDPGIGFAKRSAHSLAILRDLDRLAALGHPVLVGASRKRFIGELTGRSEPTDRAVGSAVVHAFAVARGARLIRTHDVSATRDALAIAMALRERGSVTAACPPGAH
ncbi:MAG: dihydropteroate synthase [Gemmatimonadaceae bacterium]|nr:dihydropteroate synthase [Gemmatimonadaceae bacterium]